MSKRWAKMIPRLLPMGHWSKELPYTGMRQTKKKKVWEVESKRSVFGSIKLDMP